MIDKGQFDAYDRALSANASLVQRAVAALVAECEGLAGAELQRALAQGYPELVRAYGSFAAAAAVEFYAQQRAASNVKGRFEARQYAPDDLELCRYDVRAALEASQGLEAIARSLGATSAQRVMERADETLLRNAQADPARPKWALVPHLGACGWCKMLGSNGFTYANEAKVDRSRHPNCTCTPVVDFDTNNPSLEGFDTDALHDEFSAAKKSIEGQAKAEWAEMTQGEKDRYRRKGRSSYDVFMRNRIVGEMNKR